MKLEEVENLPKGTKVFEARALSGGGVVSIEVREYTYRRVIDLDRGEHLMVVQDEDLDEVYAEYSNVGLNARHAVAELLRGLMQREGFHRTEAARLANVVEQVSGFYDSMPKENAS